MGRIGPFARTLGAGRDMNGRGGRGASETLEMVLPEDP